MLRTTMRPSLIGRTAEIVALEAALARARLVTVTGGPGIGKTALVRELVARSKTTLVVPLAHAPDALRAIAAALGIQPAAATDSSKIASQIGAALAHRGRFTVVVDDADFAVPALSANVPSWLERASGVSFIVTSRTPLGVANEERFELGPLELPPEDDDLEAIQASSAVRLFVTAAARTRGAFRLTASNARTVAEIVRHLDGVPLALELCAARTAALAETDILDMLTERLDLLDDGRGRSLRSAFELSWKQLDEEEARAVCAVALFRGTFDFPAVCAAIGATTSKERVAAARIIENLVARSLLSTLDAGEGRRYAMSSSLAAFAKEKLGRRGESREIAARLSRHYAGVEAREVDRENMEDSARRSIAARDLPTAAEILLRIAPLALGRGPLGSFVELVDLVVDAPRLSSRTRCELLLSRGLARLFQGRRDEALDDLSNAASIAKRGGHHGIEALAQSKSALVVGLKRGTAAAKRSFEAAKRAAERAKDPRISATVSKDLANVLAEAGKSAQATALLVRAREHFHAAGDVREEGFVAMMLGTRLLDEGELDAARRDLDGALELLRRAGDSRSEAWTLAMRALVDAERGEAAPARERLEASLALLRRVGDAHTEGIVLTLAGNVALELGLLEDAEAAYRDAIPLVEAADDHGLLSLARAGAALVDHVSGRSVAARDGMRRALELSQDDAREPRRQAVQLLALAIEDRAAAAEAAKAREPAAEEVRFARRVLGRVLGGVVSAADRSPVVVARDGTWVRLRSGETVQLAAARSAARVLAKLAFERVRRPGIPVAPPALVRAGWPDEQILPKAAKNRLHVTIARLRRLGLSTLIVHGPEGYMLDSREDLRLAEPGEHATVSGD